VVCVFLQRGFRPGARERWGSTALTMASTWGHLEVSLGGSAFTVQIDWLCQSDLFQRPEMPLPTVNQGG
jgi:hypothetical protein